MKSAKWLNVLKVWLCVLPTLLSVSNVFAYQLDSTNYRMVGVSTSGGGGVLESANFSMLSELGRLSANPRNYSSNYRMHQDPSAAFVAAQPSVQCFETDTAGTTDCISGPQELLDGGMVAICGGTGCYDKARFEIEGVQRMVPSCTGGDVTEFDDYYVHAFTEDGTFSCNLPVSVDVLVVGGGGGGATTGSDTGGGGAGGLIYKPAHTVSAGTDVGVVVGDGGATNNDGENSQFDNLVALGGGGGSTTQNNGRPGGSGGGAGRNSGVGGSGLQPDQPGDSGTYGYGNRGGTNTGHSGTEGMGGGGAGEPGYDAIGITASIKHGGDGLYFGDVFGEQYGEDGWFAGGGGGGGERGTYLQNLGGKGGGGRGGHLDAEVPRTGEDGMPNTGGGGGGSDNQTGGDGGSGIVLLRFKKSSVSEPVGFWGLDEPSGTGAYLLDYSGNGNHGTPTGTTFVEGIIGGARSFELGNQIFIDNANYNLSSITASAWIKPDASPDSRAPITRIDRFYFQHYADDRLAAYWYGKNPPGYHYSSTNSVPLGEWSHVAVTWGDDGVQFFINGVPDNFVETSGTGQSTNWLRIGYENSSRRFNGIIDDVRIFDRALSEGEILQEYEYGIGKRSNPSDTLYTVYISEDNFVSDTRCIDGSTFRPKSIADCDINDFRTKEHWENEVFNIKGLKQDTTYYIKISALHGDFTQSDFSKVAEATTSTAHIFFDIDIATDTGFEAESSPPHTVSFTGDDALTPGAAPVTAPSLIWLDVECSASGGMAVIHSGENGGLYSPTTTEMIPSANMNLNTGEGFGLQSYYIDYESSTFLGEITAETNYAGSGNVIGEVSITANRLYNGDGPINDGRMGIYLKARADQNRTPASDYTEFITFVLVPRY